nr:PEP-CTERM sorting domain-containing protein [uncultured Desulfobacter sp.]
MLRFKSVLGSIFISLLFFGFFCSSAYSTTLWIEEGQLMGAYDLEVNGEYFDVEFVDDSAYNIFFNTLTSKYEFLFTTSELASAASQALLDYVFIDIPAGGLYDTYPSLTNGIDNTPIYACFAITPYQYSTFDINGYIISEEISYRVAVNSQNESQDTIVDGLSFWPLGLTPQVDLTGNASTVYAIWSESTHHQPPVPAPTTILLLGSGLLTLVGLNRKKFNKA